MKRFSWENMPTGSVGMAPAILPPPYWLMAIFASSCDSLRPVSVRALRVNFSALRAPALVDQGEDLGPRAGPIGVRGEIVRPHAVDSQRRPRQDVHLRARNRWSRPG